MGANKKHITRAARELFRLCHIDGELDEARARHVAQELAVSNRRGALAMLAGLQRLLRLDREQRTAIVESAAPLDRDIRAAIRTDLARLYGPRIDTSFRENASLIGGLRIKVGSDVYDGSVRARLATLEARL